jgi:hypothetical protein
MKGVTTEKRSEMKTYTLTGIIFIVIGIVAFAYQGITYTTREKVVDIGPISPFNMKEKIEVKTMALFIRTREICIIC